jgi:hypothetical protein
MPDFQTLFGGLLAVIIAIVASSMELLSKYQARTFREIFFSPYYLFFALLNAVFCAVVYWALPYIGGVLVRSELLPSLENPLVRAIVAGLGYLVIARTSLLDITIRGQTVGIGFDGIYSALAQYLLRHHELRLREKMRDDFLKAFSRYRERPHIFLGAVRLLLPQLDMEDREEAEANLARLKSGQPSVIDFCFGLYLLLREYTEGAEGAEALLSQMEKALKSDPSYEKSLEGEFAGITSSTHK